MTHHASSSRAPSARLAPAPALWLASILALSSVAVGCGASPSSAGRGGDGTGGTGGAGGGGTGSGATGTSGGEGDDTSALLVDMVAPRICSQLAGSFVGLPGEGGHTGAESGIDPTVGRWWIRECTATVDGDRLSLAISGTGWTWVDRESMGFAVRQYLRFDSNAAFTARMEVGYDRAAHLVTVWMRPEGEVTASVEARGMVEATATNPLAGMLGGLLDLTGSSASDRARQTVAEEGSARLRERFGAGFTVTYSTDTNQMDFMVGALDRGVLPMRPYPAETDVVWSVNQRLQVFPSGIDVLGPIEPASGGQALDLDLEEGEGLVVSAVCMADFERFYDLVLQGAAASPPTGTTVMDLTGLGPNRAVVPTLGCPTLLLLTPRSAATMAVRARVRLTPENAPTETARLAAAAAASRDGASSAGGGGSSTTSTAITRPVRVHVVGLSINATAPSGSAWDTFGGEPDGIIVIASVPGRREIERFTAPPDTHEVVLDHWLPGAYHAEDLPLRFTVYDDDPVTSDELVGATELVAAQMTSTSELTLELRTTGDVPVPVGSLRVRVSPVN